MTYEEALNILRYYLGCFVPGRASGKSMLEYTRCDVCKYKEEYMQAYDYYTNIVIRQFPWSVTNITEIVKPHFSLKCREFIRDI